MIKIPNIQIMPNVMLIGERQQDNTTCPKNDKARGREKETHAKS